ncbi:MAG: hypothetical protein L0177_10990 [Chloroflexi bacterium]|nr:hypothetical protein [Chloroflexota bacterium]
MVFSFMRRPQATLEMEASEGPFRPGDEVAARVTLTSREGFQAREGRVTLTCVETYWRRETSYNSSTRSTTTHTRKHTEKLMELSAPFMSESRVNPGVRYREDVAIAIPEHAPPSLEGRLANVAWELRASLDVPGARDVHFEQGVWVASSRASSQAADAQTPPSLTDAAFEECALSLELPSREWQAGETINGALRANAARDVSFSEIRIELVCEEKAGDRNNTEAEDRVMLQQNASFMPRQSREWPFALTIPQGFRPSAFVSRTSVKWSVRGVLSRRMRTDFTVEKEIQVV